MLRLLGNLRSFWNETLNEVFVRASWPTGRELVHSTLVVTALVALAGAVVVLCDLSLAGLVQYTTSLVR
jgi:preprotein translocase SecE subunit